MCVVIGCFVVLVSVDVIVDRLKNLGFYVFSFVCIGMGLICWF